MFSSITNLCGRSSTWLLSGNPVQGWGPSSRDWTYDGSDDYAYHDESVISDYPLTLIVEFKTTSTAAANRCLFSQSNSTDASHKLGLRLNSSHQVQAFVGSNVVSFAEAANDGVYHYAGLIADPSGTVQVIYDGEFGSTVAGGTFPTLDRSTLAAIRSTTNTEFFPGSIARVILYPRQMMIAELQEKLRDLAAYRNRYPSEFLFIPEPMPIPEVFGPIHIGGWPGEQVNPLHWTMKGIEAWLPLNHPNDAISGSSLVGRISGANTAVSHEGLGAIGGRCVFNGSTSFIEYPGDDPSLTFANGQPITIFARLTPGTLDRRNIVVFKDSEFSQGNYWMALGVTSDGQRLEFGYRDATDPHQLWSNESVVAFNEEATYGVTGIFGVAGSWRMFRNGKEIEGGASWAFGTGAEAPLTGAGPLYIGQQNSATRFTGRICDVRILRVLASDALMFSMDSDPWAAMMRFNVGLFTRVPIIQVVGSVVSEEIVSIIHKEFSVMRVVEQSLLQPISSRKQSSIGQLSEDSTSRSVSKGFGVPLDKSVEESIISSITWTKIGALGQTVEDSIVRSPISSDQLVIDRVSEDSSLFAVNKVLSISQTESDEVVNSVVHFNTYGVSQILSNETLSVIVTGKTGQLGETISEEILPSMSMYGMAGSVVEDSLISTISTTKHSILSQIVEEETLHDLNLVLVISRTEEEDRLFSMYVFVHPRVGKAQYISRSRRPQYKTGSTRLGMSPVGYSLAPVSQEIP